jgi:hypothetical protein
MAMVCDIRLKPKQTLQQRAEEVRRAVICLSEALASGRVKARVGPQGAIAFVGWNDAERDGVTDACAYRRLMVTGSALAKAAIARAEQARWSFCRSSRGCSRRSLTRWRSYLAQT